MNSSVPRRRANTVLEYALYAAILLMTVSGAFLYNTIAHDPVLAAFTRYLVVSYLVFLAIAFGQLNSLHRKRAGRVSQPKPKAEAQAVVSTSPILGLTLVQLAIAAFVFVTACVTFTWALSILR